MDSSKYNVTAIIDKLSHKYTMFDYKNDKGYPSILLKDPQDLAPEEQFEYNETAFKYIVQAVLNAVCIEDFCGVLPEKMVYVFIRHLNSKKNNYGLLEIDITQEHIDLVFKKVNEVVANINNNHYPKTKNKQKCTMYNGCEYKTMCDLQNLCLHRL